MSGMNILIGAIAAILFYVVASWLLTIINFAIGTAKPNLE